MLLLGIGAGIAFPALMNVAMTGATPEDAGLASGLVNTTAQVGGALGLAVLATLSESRSRTLKHAGESTLSALTGGYHLAFWIATALVGVRARWSRSSRCRRDGGRTRQAGTERVGAPSAEGATGS